MAHLCCGERWIYFSLYDYLRAGDAPAKDIGTAAAYCFQRALFAPRHPRIGGLFLGMAGPLYLLPSSYLMWATSVYGNSIDLAVLSPVASLVVVYVAVRMVKTYHGSRNKAVFYFSWKECLVVAAIASVLNGTTLSMLYDSEINWILMIGYSSGDMAGQIVLLVLIVALMRLNRKLSKLI